jgi:potassium efflux system protein
MNIRVILCFLLFSIGFFTSTVNMAATARDPATATPIRYELLIDEEVRYYHDLPNSVEQWKLIGAELVHLFSLTEDYFVHLGTEVLQVVEQSSVWQILLSLVLLILWWSISYGITWLAKQARAHLLFSPEKQATFIGQLVEYIAQIWLRNVTLLVIIGSIIWYLLYLNIPDVILLFALFAVLLAVKFTIDIARIILFETFTDNAGQDVKLYHALKWGFILGGLLTGLTVLAHQMPISVYMIGFIDRLFLLILLGVSIALLKNWKVVPLLLQPYVERRYLRRALSILSALIPLVLLSTAIIGLVGYVVLAWRIGIVEAKFLLVLVAWILVRGVVNDIMGWLSNVFIRKIPNGWLWSEAVLKPVWRILNIVAFCLVIVVFFWIYDFQTGSLLIEQIREWLKYTLFTVSGTEITLRKLLVFIVILAVVVWMAKWSREFAYRWLFAGTKDYGLRNTFAVFSQYLTVFIGGVIILQVLGIDLTTLTVVLGALSLGIGIGLQNLANSLVSGLILLIERPIQVGDLVKIGDQEGEIMRMGMRSVTLNTWDHKEVIIPNADTMNQAVTNWTHRDNVIRIETPIRVGFDQDPHAVKKIIQAILHEHIGILDDPEPEVLLMTFAESYVLFDARFYIDLRAQNTHSFVQVRSEILFRIWDELKKHNIPMPYPMHTVNLLK